jgi:phospholipase C
MINNLGKYAKQLPPQTAPHIGDRLDAAGVTWAWYTGGWNSGTNPPAFPTLPYFADMAPGTPGYSLHLKDQADFLAALQDGSLPSVAFVKPDPNEHPDSGASLAAEDQSVADLVKAVQDSPYWPSSAVIVTYDENGGWWDHVAPPQVDRWGPGTRIPAIIVSPYAKKGFVDHTVYDTTSILRFIEWRWSLPPLGTRDAQANNLLNAFDFSQ